MPRGRIPQVIDGQLTPLDAASASLPTIAVGSTAWYTWLASNASQSFAFRSSEGSFTARREQRQGSWYWYAYRTQSGQLRKEYLGKPEELTLERLRTVAARLAKTVQQPRTTNQRSTSDRRRLPTADGHPLIRNSQHATLLATKLYVPRLRPTLVSRPRFRARLDAGLAGALTLVSAPAGFGKTTLLADWLHHTAHPVAWLSLDEADNDPSLFLQYLIAALQTIAPDAGRTTASLLQSVQSPPLPSLLTVLLNDLTTLAQESILVLDDYHVIAAPPIHQALTFLLDHLPPQLHLVLATRADPPLPLARLRARGQLSELRAADLRFTAEEAAMFLTEVMGLPLSASDVAALEARTEGWIAGLQFAALAMRDHTDLAGFVQAFTGSHRFVVDYLAEEVLARQPAHLQTFLLQTSILDRLCGPLCDAVVGDQESEVGRQGMANVVTSAPGPRPSTPGPRSQALLMELERANLFIVPLDDERQWYRYHHLFAEVLRKRLASGAPREVIATLHRRASAWFEQHGLVVEAVQHALAAHDWPCAGRLIEAHGRLLMRNGQMQTVRAWLQTLPDAVVRTSPYLCLIDALGLFFANQLEAAELRLLAAETSLSTSVSDDRSRSILGYALVIRASIARYRGDLARCIALARQALELLPPTDGSARMPAGVHLAQAYLLSGDVSPANERLVADHVARARASGELTGIFYAIVTLAGLQHRQGRLRQAATTYREAGEVAAASGGPAALVNGAAYYFGLGDLLREWNDLASAADLLRQGRTIVLGALATPAETLALGYIALARLQQAQGDGCGALATLDEFEQVARQRNVVPQMLARGAAARAQLALVQDDLPAAVRWADTSGLQVDDDLSYVRELEYLTLVRVRIAQGRHDAVSAHLRDALHLLDRLLQAAETGRRMDSVIEILLLRALAVQAQDDLTGGLADLERALLLAEPEGYVRVFLDEGAPMAALLTQGLGVRGWGLGHDRSPPAARAHAHKLLAAFGVETTAGVTGPTSLHPISSPQPPSPDVEPLSPRELEVLRLIAAGQSNPEIARTLVIATSTVKAHINSIFGKLGVTSRTQALARARDLHLL